MATAMSTPRHSDVEIAASGCRLQGVLGARARPRGFVLLARDSRGDAMAWTRVADALERRGFATLSLDLITAADAVIESRMRHSHFEVTMLAARLAALVEWARREPRLTRLPIGILAEGDGAGAALMAAALRPREIAAVVACDGQVDLAGPALEDVSAPTLFIVGGLEAPAIAANREAMARMPGEVVLDIVPDVSRPGVHGTGAVAALAVQWFERYLVRPSVGEAEVW